MNSNKSNALLFVAMVTIAASPQTIDWVIDKYNDSTSTYLGMITCSDGKTMTDIGSLRSAGARLCFGR